MKTPTLIQSIERDLAAGHAAGLQLVSTGEALMERRLAGIPTEEWGDLAVDITPRETVLCRDRHKMQAGGVKLGQSTWHSARPPEIPAAVDNEGPFGIAIAERGALSQRRHFSQYDGRAVVSMAELGLADGDYEVQLIRATAQGESKIAQALGFRLRTADHPRPPGVREALDGAHDLS